MRSNVMNRRRALALLLCGLLLTALCIGESDSAAAFRMGGFGRGGFGRGGFGHGGFGHMGGFGRSTATGSGWRRPIASRGGNGTLAARSPVRGGGGFHRPIGEGPRFHPVFGGGTSAGPVSQGGGGGAGPGGGGGGGGGGAGINGVPPPGELRFVRNEVITEFSQNASPQAIGQLARQYNLTQLETQSFPLIGSSLYRWRVGGRRSVPDLVGALQREGIVASTQPNYIFTVQDPLTKSAADTPGDEAQYVLGKLQIVEAHHVATGTDVSVAVIDSQIDAKHPDLDGSIAGSFDALGGPANPHSHGTAIAGAIAAHGKLLGIAPGVKLLAERAFDDTQGAAKGTSFAIYKSIEQAADKGARVVNMSFAGPPDPTMHRMLAAAYAKDMVLIAAAGNAGPKSTPLYPAADPDVIAVTATDSNDALFDMANHGRYIAVAAPGVEIVALAPREAYQITTGTSVAAAHVSGIVALMLQRKPSLKPSDIRAMIAATAKPLGSADEHDEFGAGLVNAYRALTSPEGDAAQAQDGESVMPQTQAEGQRSQ